MADIEGTTQSHPNLQLSPDERRFFGQLFAQADADKLGVVTGERAVSFFEKTRLSSDVLGEIWQIADTENRGLLTPSGFGMVLRLIGYAQAGRTVNQELAFKPGGPLPRFDGITTPGPLPSAAAPLQQQNSGAIRVPPLTVDRVAQYTSLFEESGAQNGVLPGETAKSIFERAQLPNETLGRIWALADTEQKGALGLTEFIIAMHLLASMKNGSMRALPQVLPVGLYEAAARRGGPPPGARSRPTSNEAVSAIPRQFSGGFAPPQKTGTGEPWLVNPQDKAQFDSIFATVDTQNRGFITGEQAVGFFGNARLPEEALAQIWDLADINSEGQLNRDEFAVAMYLIRQQRSKTTGRDVLPQQLPPQLIPPNMRRQPVAPQQPTAPAFDNAANVTKPKSASDDLFGLDVLPSPAPAAPIQARSTGDSSAYATPPRNQGSPAPTSAQSSHFRPFIPSSTFGQSIIPQQPTTTGTTSPAATRSVPATQQPSAMDDLLGDNDPEVSKKLTTETSDLANLSNQVGQLTGQMQEIKSKGVNTQQDLGQAQNQKRQFETRLSELRAAYEQEVREVRALEERLRESREGTRKLQSDYHMIGGTHEDLKNQHRQVSEALVADQNENAGLKERIRAASAEIEQLKPQLEKIRSDARHQKGLVAINKKQLATHEAEREKIKAEAEVAKEEHAQATREAEQSQRSLDTASQAKAPPPATSPPVVGSPTPSTAASMNPFFRRPSNPPPAERGPIASPFTPQAASSPFVPPSVSSPNHNAFDSFFGPPAVSSTPPPPTSFKSDSPSAATRTVDSGLTSTPPASSVTSNTTDSPATASEPPAPPQSRQITSSFLPLRPNLEDSASESSSVKVIPPASRAGERSETPTYDQSEATIPESPLQHFQDLASKPPQSDRAQLTPPSSQQTPEIPAQEVVAPHVPAQVNPLPTPHDVPGAFPGDETPSERTQPSPFIPSVGPYGGSGLDPRVDAIPEVESTRQAPHLQPGIADPFGRSSTPTSAKDDFDNAFSGFSSNKGKKPEQHNGAITGDPFAPSAPQQPSEFPPIKELNADDESDSDSDKGFDDDFTTRSAKKTKESGPNDALQGQGGLVSEKDFAPPRLPFNISDSPLPTPGAQQSPPTYDQIVGPADAKVSDRKGSNQFPAEYSGLLPSRDDPTSPPLSMSPPEEKSNLISSTGIDRGLNFFPDESTSRPTEGPLTTQRSPMSPGATMNAPYAYTHTSPDTSQPPTLPAKIPPTPKDDFDDFEDLTPAQEEDEKGDDTINFGRSTTDPDFNPIFDSPSTSHHAPGQSQSSSQFPHSTTDSVNDFASTTAAPGQQKQPVSVSHDWDAIFAGLDAPSSSSAQQNNTDDIFAPSSAPNGTQHPSSIPPPQTRLGAETAAASSAGGFAGAPSNGAELRKTKSPASVSAPVEVSGEDDDPILKRLIGMGFPRAQSLKALEKYDYNIDKAAEYLLATSGK
ncbi:uncharacterized protein KY384_000122 [Bacidia gigantensis]|uniref:uncharacterized protein n=1 Tax=Bacidia gigantensis TaxID=2732470 RepID=UPI001D03D79C|nr:uncharacterized protein KY384_000122 [Bacidia gigantensis]KAG8526129.1 hypothetical protein KY384_000122 [Bacidia gigantensis]